MNTMSADQITVLDKPMAIGQTLPLAEGGKNGQGQNCQAPSTVHWKSLNTNVMQIVGTGSTVGAKAVGGGNCTLQMTAGEFDVKYLKVVVADANGCVETVIIVGTPH